MIGKRLKKLRGRRTQEEIARLCGVSRAVYSHWENDRNDPDLERLQKLAEIFNVSIDYLVGSDKTSDNTEESLTPYQQEVIDFFNSREDLFFHDHPGDIRDALEQFEIYYEVWKKQQNKNNK